MGPLSNDSVPGHSLPGSSRVRWLGADRPGRGPDTRLVCSLHVAGGGGLPGQALHSQQVVGPCSARGQAGLAAVQPGENYPALRSPVKLSLKNIFSVKPRPRTERVILL